MAKKKSSSSRAARSGNTSTRRGVKLPGLGPPTLWGVWLLLLLTPFVFLPGLTDNFRPPKLFVAELTGLLSVALLSLRARRSPRQALGELWRLPTARLLAPLVVVVCAAAAFSEHGEHVRRSLPSFLIGAVVFVGWSAWLRAEERRTLLRATVMPAVLLAGLAILQFHDLFSPFDFDSRVTERVGLTSLAGGVFDLAGYLFLPILVTVAWIRQAAGALRYALGGALGICLYALLIGRTFTVLVALVAALAVYFLPHLPRRKAALGFAAVLAVSIVAVVAVAPLRERTVSKIHSLEDGDLNRVLTGRLDGWRTALHMFETHPLLGVGPGAFRAEFGPAKMALIDEGTAFFRGQHQVFFVNAHNDFLEAAAEWGSLGVLALAWALLQLYLARSRRQDGEGHGSDLRALEPAVCVGTALAAMVNFPFHLALVAYPCLLFFSGLTPDAGPAGEDDPPAASKGLPIGPILAVLCLAAAVARFGQVKDLLGADRLTALTELRTAQLLAGSGQGATQIVHQNVSLLKKAQELDPASVAAKIGLAGQYMLQKRWSAAERELEDAAELETRAEIYANLAQIHLATGDKERALAAIDTAIKLDHNQRKAFRSLTDHELRLRRRQETQKGSGE